MTKEQADFLVKVSESCGNQDIDLRNDYSGRSFYGRTTCGVVVNSLPVLLVDVINYMKDNNVENVPDFDGLSIDSMARDIILY